MVAELIIRILLQEYLHMLQLYFQDDKTSLFLFFCNSPEEMEKFQCVVREYLCKHKKYKYILVDKSKNLFDA